MLEMSLKGKRNGPIGSEVILILTYHPAGAVSSILGLDVYAFHDPILSRSCDGAGERNR
jgi:hypothetical protein